MTKILINGQEAALNPSVVLLGALVDSVAEQLKQSSPSGSNVIAGIKIDGRELDEQEQAKLANQPLESLGTIEILTANPVQLAQDTLLTLETYLDRILQNISKAAEAYTARNYITADHYFSKTVDGLDLFVQTMTSVKMAMRIGLSPKLALFEATLSSIVTDLLDAKRQSNYVLLAELLAVDLTENLKEWRTDGFQLIRNWKSS